MKKEPLTPLITCGTKPLSKVTLSTQNFYVDNEQDKFFRIQF